MRLKNHLDEMAVLSKRDEWNYFNFMQDLRDAAVSKSDPVLWRGWRGGSRKIGKTRVPDPNSNAPLIKISSQRTAAGMFFGKDFGKYNVDFVIKSLGLDNYSPVFTTKDYDQAKFFGIPYVVVPIGPFKSLYNPDVRDFMDIGVDWEQRNKTGHVQTHEKDFDKQKMIDAVNGYKRINGVPKGGDSNDGEIMVLVDTYWLISPATYIERTKGKLKVFKNGSEIKTYGDLYNMMLNFLTFYRWQARKDIEENPQHKETFLAPGGKYGSVPKEWFE